MTAEQAIEIKVLRVTRNCSWRAIAQICHDWGWGNWSPPSQKMMGMALCKRAAELLDENPDAPPWN